MRPIREQVGREMRWRRTRFIPRAFELRAGDEVLASLTWPKLIGRQAIATAAEGEWRFRRASLFSLRVVLEDAATGAQVGEYSSAPLSGTLRLSDGREYGVGRDSLFGRFRLRRASGGEIAWFPRRPAFTGGGPMQLEAAASAEPQLGLLTTFAFFLLTLRRRRAAASSGGG